MKITTRAFGFAMLILAALGGLATAVGGAPLYQPDVIIVKLKPGAAGAVAFSKRPTATGLTSFDQLSAQFGVTALRRTVPDAGRSGPDSDPNRLSDFFTVELPEGTDVGTAVAAFGADPNVLVAEPNYIMPIYATPNDPSYPIQWTHRQLSDYDIDSDSAWDLEVGDSTVKVGVIDSGVKFDHPDLIASTWVNPGEDLDHDGVVWDAGDMNGVDDDGNGKIDDLVGYDFLAGAGSCWPGEDCGGVDNNPVDFAGHGTHVAGIIAATTSNGIGVAGIAGGMRSERKPGVRIMCLRAGYLANDGRGYVVMDACANAFNYAVANGVAAINCSWGSSGDLIWTAAENAVANGVVVCVAAGNDNTYIPGGVLDTAYGLLNVASLNRSDVKSSFSNFGDWVDISAPGEFIINTYSNLGAATYDTLSGTSMASPTVVGVAALLKSHHPWFTKTEIDTLLLNTADPNIYLSNPGFIGLLGRGRVNAYKPLSLLTTANFTIDTAFGRAPLTVHFTNTSPNAPSGPYKYLFGDGDSALTANATHIYNQPGVRSVKFTGSGPSGPHTRVRPELIVVIRDTIQYVPINLELRGMAPVPVRLRNTHPMKEITLPFLLSGAPTVYIDSITMGPRTAGWSIQIGYDNSFYGEIAGRLSAGNSPDLAAGDGIVAYLWVRSGYSNTVGQVKTVDSANFNDAHWLRLKSNWADFRPDFAPATITMVAPPCDCPEQGDINGDGVIDVFDVIEAIAVAFSGGTDPKDPNCPASRTDVNNDGLADVFDVIYLIATAFTGGNSPIDPCL
jgi:subtilisin family serine protease